ncbi:unnamed protein product [Ixodes hexagonus]
MDFGALLAAASRWCRTRLDPLLGAPATHKVVGHGGGDASKNPCLLYTAVFVGGSLATFMLALAIMSPVTPSYRDSGRPRYAGASQGARQRGLVFSRQGMGGGNGGWSSAVPLVCVYDRNSERAKEPVRYQMLKHLPARYCSHLVYGFVSPVDLNNSTSKSTAGSVANARRRLKQMVQLKKHSPALKVLVAVGGPKVDSKAFSDELITEGRREHFAQRAVRWLRSLRLDGLLVQWMFPGQGNGRPSDRQNLPRLMAQLRKAFKAENSAWQLLIYMPHDDGVLDRGYEVRAVSNTVDHIIMGTYGYVEPGLTEITSPLFNRAPSPGRSPTNSIHELVTLLVDRGAPRHKLLIGVSAAGVSYSLARGDTSVRAPLRSKHAEGNAGPFTQTPGRLAYFEVCYNVYRNNWARVFDAATSCPYAYSGLEWVTYDDPDSLRAKVAFLRNQSLGGAALMDVAADDYMAMCGPRNVLSRTLHASLKHYAPRALPSVQRQRGVRKRRWGR